jgi:hypothetical protein
MAWFALVSARSSLTVDIHRSQEADDAEFRDILRDEPEWVSLLSVVPVELPEPHPN